MIPDRDIWLFARLMILEHGSDAAFRAGKRAEWLEMAGDLESARVWLRLRDRILQLERPTPPAATH